jgi:cytochrome c-type biogenesis protein CcmH
MKDSPPQRGQSDPPHHTPERWALRDTRGSVRTSVVSIITLLVLAAAIVVVLFRSLAPPEAPSMTGGAPTASPEGPAISGTLTITPDLAGRVRDTAVVFIIARRPSGPLFAVKRIAPPRFPLAYRIGPEDVMMAGEAFDGEARVSARVSQTGSAGPPQPGDLEGEHGAPVRIGARNVDVVIARVR